MSVMRNGPDGAGGLEWGQWALGQYRVHAAWRRACAAGGAYPRLKDWSRVHKIAMRLGRPLAISVSPRQIRRVLQNARAQGLRDGRFLISGDWVRNAVPLEDCVLFQEFTGVLEWRGRDEDLPLRHNFRSRLAATGPFNRPPGTIASLEDIDRYCAYRLEIAASFRKHGVLPSEYYRRVGNEATPAMPGMNARQGDPVAAIGPDGELLLIGGRHRLAAARATGQPAIQVGIELIDVGWLQAQCESRRCGPDALIRSIDRFGLAYDSAMTVPDTASQPGWESV